ncbi:MULTISPECIES: cytochrome c biogenesis heme-transporting ATPase CcmA [Methylomonas]|uniref:Heme ABC exporter ATP-binding protein CcmA n=1 Tax=Methylomonas koyamae TaxID=702114 RepID=A0A291IJK7_9GAMM|nr:MULTISPECIES: cytochrome c biogenesis heme-transporting ATPase CcmA [Methylomonas]ANE55508.1 heme ABC transporter ATP-binding protein CcmA [Methylomonas sp. DH-1]ATG90371.1 heme exporter protein A [Methylomonas koyamae]OAI26685.1 heme ABC exporter ATP-binding protein CcmA [Methylomonas koyamae]WNB77952.1 cytochrome c biogenesis heme-transporting ATPase CcmA [Methylomonas koyamae]
MDNLQHAALEVRDLSCFRDERLLFSALNFEVQAGQSLLLEGANGSGKTTLLRILCGLREADSGQIIWCGQPAERSSYYRDMAYVGHADGTKKELTVLENLNFALALGAPGKYRIDEALDKVRLAGFDDNPVHTLSAGQKRRLSLARLLITQNLLWILDEPFTSLDKHGIALIESLIADHIGHGGIAVLTSHHDLRMADLNLKRIHLQACH